MIISARVRYFVSFVETSPCFFRLGVLFSSAVFYFIFFFFFTNIIDYTRETYRPRSVYRVLTPFLICKNNKIEGW